MYYYFLVQGCDDKRVTIRGKLAPANSDAASVAKARAWEFSYDCDTFQSQIETANDVGLLIRHIRSWARDDVVTAVEVGAAYEASDLRRMEFLVVDRLCRREYGVELKR